MPAISAADKLRPADLAAAPVASRAAAQDDDIAAPWIAFKEADMTDWLIPLVTLTAMEIVLGIDNIIFIAIVADRLPEKQRPLARRLGLMLALGTRLLLLLTLSWLLRLTAPVFLLSNLGLPADWFDEKTNEISWRDIILLVGGLFLIAKSTSEIHHKLEGADGERTAASAGSFALTLVQIALMDVIFSLDSVITAVGMVHSSQLWVMVLAIVLAVGVMLAF